MAWRPATPESQPAVIVTPACCGAFRTITAAKALGSSRHQLYIRMRKHGFDS